MANTYVDYTGDGSETDFNFSFPYIKTSHVAVEVNEGPAGGTNRWVRTSDFTVQTSPTTFVRFNSAPANLVRVRVLRDSDASTGIVDFANGSVLTETELDNAYEHNRYLAEEAEEGKTGGALVKNPDTGQFDADALRLENLADPDSDDDAVNKGYADTRFVNVTGDTMTGSLAMSNNNITGVNTVSGLATPTSDDHAANKKYVDDEVAAEAAARVSNDALQVTKSGDSMSGNLTMTSPAKVIQNQAPTSGDDLTNKTYVDNATTTLTNDKVSKSGDTMTGPLTLPNADPSNGNHATRKTYVDAQIAATLATGVAGGPVDTVNIADEAVETAKIADDAVTAAKLDNTTVTPGSYTNTDITVDENGRITAASSGSAAATNLGNTPAASSVEITSSTGTNTTVAGATTSLAGVMTGADKTKLNGIATGATANSSDATLLSRANHTGTQTAATISDFDTEVANNTAVAANTAKVSNATHTGDVTGSTALTIANNAVTFAKMQQISNSRVIGNMSGSIANPEPITIIDDDTMGTAANNSLATSESIKAYVDSQVVSVSKWDSGWVSQDNQTSSTSLGNNTVLTFSHTLGTANIVPALYVNGNNTGTSTDSYGNGVISVSGIQDASFNDGCQIIDVTSSIVKIRFASAGLEALNTSGNVDSSYANWGAGDASFIKLVLIG
jgi:hypothetical protein